MVKRIGLPLRRSVAIAVLLACASGEAIRLDAAASQQPGSPPAPMLYRIFLKDGGVLVSYGEFAQVADRVVLSIPIGGTDDEPALHLLTIAGPSVDWERTNAYAEAARARRYAETRGPDEFAELSRQVAGLLNQISFVKEPDKRLALAEAARKQLLEWPQQHYGYRAAEIADMSAWLDPVVSELRVAAGHSSFDLALVAHAPVTTPAVDLMPAPSGRERIELALTAARVTVDAPERISLLRAVVEAPPAGAVDPEWTAIRERASAELAREQAIDASYAELSTNVLTRADAHVRRANVRGLESLIRSVLEQDAALKRARPAEFAALLATLDARLDAARRLRLARDTWAARGAVLRGYWTEVRQGLDRLLGLRSWLVDIRQLAGPTPRSLRRLIEAAAIAKLELERVNAPAEVASAHATLQSATALAVRAAADRHEAVRTGSMETAWQASSAAAGSLMLLDQAVAELRRITWAPRP